MRYYVYCLLNSESKQPFFGGIHQSEITQRSGFRLTRGQLERLLQNEDGVLSEAQRVQIQQILDDWNDSQPNEDTYRVIVRNLESPEHAQLVRDALLASCEFHGGCDGSSSRQSLRFRPHEYIFANHSHIEGFDAQPTPEGKIIRDNGDHLHGPYFVYGLFDPASGACFYVGKGKGNRISTHWRQAETLERQSETARRGKKLERLRSILDQGHQPIVATKILARVSREDEAYLLESFFLKFVFGSWSLENATGGRRGDLFRAHGDTRHRFGFEIPESLSGRGGRRIKEDLFKGAGFDMLLNDAGQVLNNKLLRAGYSTLQFTEPAIIGAGELAITAQLVTPLGQIRLIMHIRSAQTGYINCSTHPHGPDGKMVSRDIWRGICERYRLGAPKDIGFRGDAHCNPRAWQKQNLALDIDTATDRAFFLYRLLMSAEDQQEGFAEEVYQQLSG